MDHKELSYKLSKFGKEVPKDLRDRLMKTEVDKDLQVQKERAERIVSNPNVPKDTRRFLYDKIQSGEYDKKIEVIDRKVEDRIDRMQTEMMRAKIRSGELPDPRKVVKNDAFYQERMRIHRNAK